MFTGIIETLGEVRAIGGGRLRVASTYTGIELGESVAINGCCLTVTDWSENTMGFDLSDETLARTAFTTLGIGAKVNLERAMLASSRFGGHIVQGHVDDTAELMNTAQEGNSTILTFKAPAARYLMDKGSIALNGVSLTVVRPNDEGEFETWVIPHTLTHTTLGQLELGDKVNVEYDVLAKYIERLVHFEPAQTGH